MSPRRARRPVETAHPEWTDVPPADEAAAAAAPVSASAGAPIDGAQLDAAILRAVRKRPNRTVDLQPLAEELGVDPGRVQLAIESLHRRRMVIAPFIEPSSAGGATLTNRGNRWLLEYEGGAPLDTPVALQPATERVRPEDEAARLPRSQVYGINRG